MDRKELLNKLISLDEEASMVLPSNERINMTIVGGGALILGNYVRRMTMDIDVIDMYPKLQSILEKYDVNNRCNAFSDSLAENYQDRLTKLDIETKAINYYLLSLEDLVIMKLYSDRPKDYLDISGKEVTSILNWDLLEKIIVSGEADTSFNELRYKHFLDKYEKYKREFRK